MVVASASRRSNQVGTVCAATTELALTSVAFRVVEDDGGRDVIELFSVETLVAADEALEELAVRLGLLAVASEELAVVVDPSDETIEDDGAVAHTGGTILEELLGELKRTGDVGVRGIVVDVGAVHQTTLEVEVLVAPGTLVEFAAALFQGSAENTRLLSEGMTWSAERLWQEMLTEATAKRSGGVSR